MDLPLSPPLEPMLGKLTRELPADGYLYEPKWDGFRCLAFRDREEVDLRSRHGRPLGRYFPEIAGALGELPVERFVIDGELVLLEAHRHDFGVLMSRLHPAATRVERLRREAPATLVAFDLLALGEEDLTSRPFRERHERLRELLGEERGRIRITPLTDDPEVAREWLHAPGTEGVDGVMAKQADAPYQPGARTMLKVKLERTVDCVVAGFRPLLDRPGVASLLLGLYRADGSLEHVGVASSFTDRRRVELLAELDGFVTSLAGHPWEHGYLTSGGHLGRLAGSAGRWSPGEMELDWVPLSPERVCEVAYEHVDHGRFRHPARFRRWRDDRDPRSCTFEQFEVPV